MSIPQNSAHGATLETATVVAVTLFALRSGLVGTLAPGSMCDVVCGWCMSVCHPLLLLILELLFALLFIGFDRTAAHTETACRAVHSGKVACCACGVVGAAGCLVRTALQVCCSANA